MDLTRPLSVVTPTLDGDVLARLAHVESAFTPGDLHRLLPSASVDGIRRALNRLAAQGVVDTTRVGRAISYRLNRDHVAAGPIADLVRLRETALDRIAVAVGSWEVQPAYAAVFGSWARREATSESDIDLFLVRPVDAAEEAWEDQVHRIEKDATRWTGNDTRSLVLAETDIRSNPDDPVLASVLRDGAVVGGDPSWLDRTVTESRSVGR